jgi:hypothetical protein
MDWLGELLGDGVIDCDCVCDDDSLGVGLPEAVWLEVADSVGEVDNVGDGVSDWLGVIDSV